MRRGFLRRLLTACVVLGAGAALAAGCGSGDDGGGSASSTKDSDKQVKIGVFLASSANSYFAANLEGIKTAAKAAGASVTVFDGAFNANTQVNQLRDALLSKRFDAWLVAPVDGGPVTASVTQALKQDVAVGCILTPCGADVADQSVQIPGIAIQTGFGYVQNGKDLGEQTVKACEGKDPCRVFWMPGNPQQPLESARQDGLYSVIKGEPNIKVVAVQPGEYLPGPAFTATQNVLQANPDVDVIVSSGDQMISGAYRAAAQAGKGDGSIKMIGAGCTVEAVELIAAGKTYACIALLPRSEGQAAAKEVIKVAQGAASRGVVLDPAKDSNVGKVVTKENADQFEAQFHS